jgi:hypothetical protein
MIELTTNSDTAYKFKDASGKWTPLLHYVAKKKDTFVFKPVEDTQSTAKVAVISIFLAAEGDLQNLNAKVFTMCKFYGSWEPAPHVCGKDCPLGK